MLLASLSAPAAVTYMMEARIRPLSDLVLTGSVPAPCH